MGFFGLFGGAPKSEKEQQSKTFSDLGNLFGTVSKSGEDLTKKGNAAQGRAANFFGRTLSGDRTAIAPAVNTAVEAGDAAKREEAQMGTSRGGGTNAGNQERETHTRSLMASLLGQAQEGAADKLAAIGGEDINAGIGAEGTAGAIGTNLSSLLNTDIQQKNQAASKMWGSLIGGGLKLATAGLFPTPK